MPSLPPVTSAFLPLSLRSIRAPWLIEMKSGFGSGARGAKYIAVAVAQLRFQNLAVGVARQLIEREEPLWNLVSREAHAQRIDRAILFETGARQHANRAHARFAEVRMRHAEHRGLGDAGKRVDR